METKITKKGKNTMEKLKRALTRAGLTWEEKQIRRADGAIVPGVKVCHNYDGARPDDAARAAETKAVKTAYRYGYKAVMTGYHMATLIYKEA